jgi:hypothetical protein
MKRITNIIIIILFISPLLAYSQAHSLRVKLNVSDSSKINKIIGKAELHIKGDSTDHDYIADSNLSFLVRNINFNWETISIRNIQLGLDTCTNGYIQQNFGFKEVVFHNYTLKNHDIYIEINYPPECKYDNNKCDNTCPKCNKTDMVLPILYGFPIDEPVMHISKYSDYYPGGCSITGCEPHWYCERDKLEY